MYEERRLDSPHIECVWQARAVRDERYLAPAVEYWDLWFARRPGGEVLAGLSGPSLGHRWIASAVGEHVWGVQLRAHVVVPGLSKQLVLGAERRLPVRDGHVEITRHRVPLPEFGELTTFVDQLLDLGIVRSDDAVRRALSGDDAGYSERHWQRRVRASTGLTRKQIAQLVRAREAFALLQQGVPPAECATLCGYADQAHLTRSLRVFHGQTPARILATG
ncbi:transcriptional regulator, AraC family [Beutenbergia cavernae DSM 12333]|uniref:Transcriptional regulator, AraC family n=2 Tax=Beutenbergia TaxID=84756 RepID=C5BYD8_BEUC1|nr:transcriptional regulator, AraC family [Beutenbergia cavernae DSM 12333]